MARAHTMSADSTVLSTVVLLLPAEVASRPVLTCGRSTW